MAPGDRRDHRQCYWRAFDYPFQYDDIHSIVENPNLTSLTNLPRYFTDPTLFSSAPGSSMYRPVLLLSYAINRACGGLNPVGYRWVNLAVHVACALLLATVAAAWTGRYSVGVIAGAVFGLHPINEFMRGVIDMDPAGHVITDLQMQTNVPGVFAAGDVRTFSDRQLANAVGDGVAAALAAYRYITEG